MTQPQPEGRVTARGPISPADTDRFFQELVRNSDDTGISAEQLDAAYTEFVRMNIDHAAMEMWWAGQLEMSWSDNNGMVWKLTDKRHQT